MNETTRKETIAAVREIYAKRLKLIDRAIKAAEAAQDAVPYSASFSSAIHAMKYARANVERQRDLEIKYWEGLE